MRFITSRGKQSQLGSQNWFDEKSELSLRMEMRFWGRATRGMFFSSSTVDLESLSVLSDLERNSSGTRIGLKENEDKILYNLNVS